MEPLKILLCAYACAPEPSPDDEAVVGWRWALETATLGHEVWVITRQSNRASIEPAVRTLAAAGRLPRLRFLFFDLPAAGERYGRWRYAVWQWQAYRRARQLHQERSFDAVHHVTGSRVSQPTFMGRLGLPLILGPLHGAERISPALRPTLSPWRRLWETLRAVGLRNLKFDPLLRHTFRQAALILMRTPDAAGVLPSNVTANARCLLDVGVDVPPRFAAEGPSSSTAESVRELRLLHVGRFVYFSGLALGLQALADLRGRGVEARLTLTGQGPEEERLRRLADSLGVADRVVWRASLNEGEQGYADFDALLYPSLRNADGRILLAALAHGLPVVCLQIGLPGEVVDSDCGRAVAVAGRSEGDVRHGLVTALADMAADPWLRMRLRAGALARARQFSWDQVVARVWGPSGMAYLTVTRSGH